MGNDTRVGEGAGQSKDVAGSRRAAARSADPTQVHSTLHTKVSQSNDDKAQKANKVDISERDNSRIGKIAGLRIAKSRIRIPAWAAPPEPELGPRSSVLGPRSSVLGYLFGAVGASLFLVAVGV